MDTNQYGPDQYGPETYGDRIAEVYDDLMPVDDQDDAAAFLAGLAGEGPALELGIGTGRVALPLAAHGVEVHGVDASEAMIAKLRAKPGGADIPVTVTDMASLDDVGGDYSLVYVLFNTFFAVLTQDDQVRCFEQVAERLRPGGSFVVQAFAPDPNLLRQASQVIVRDVGTDRVHLIATTRDLLGQMVSSTHVIIDGQGTRLYPVVLRYAWPSELDLMARIAGLRLDERWGDWARARPTATGSLVSVYRKPA
jgi:SAM-dependent methyltransferase